MDIKDWPKCAVPACLNRCCLKLNSKYCWSHTPLNDATEVGNSLFVEELRDLEEGSYGSSIHGTQQRKT
jgi:hypothetical protein